MTVPWETCDGEMVERVIATYICLERPSSVRVRPSQGDGGIDVIEDLSSGKKAVFQIKKFATNLTSGQKSQIMASLNAAKRYAATENYELAEWNLVTPLDPTKENLRWFEELTQKETFSSKWMGKSHVDGWAAKMPFVTDYYLQGNRDSIIALAKSLLSATSHDVSNASGLIAQIQSIQDVLNTTNPNYRIDFQVLNDFCFDKHPCINRKEGLVMSTIEEIGMGKAIQFDFYAKHNAAADLAPISGSFTLSPETKEQQQDLRSHIDYGTPLKGFPARIKFSDVPFLESEIDLSSGKLSVFDPFPIKMLDVRMSNEYSDVMNVTQDKYSQGLKGVLWTGSTEKNIFRIEIKADFGQKPLVRIASGTDGLVGCAPSTARRLLSFVLSGFNSNLTIYVGNTKLAGFQMNDLGVSRERVERSYHIAELLTALEGITSKPVLFPENVAESQVKELENAINLVRKGSIDREWIKFRPEQPLIDCPFDPLIIEYVDKLVVHCGSESYQCGYVRHTIEAIWNSDEEAFVPNDEENSIDSIEYIGSFVDPKEIGIYHYRSIVNSEQCGSDATLSQQ